MALALTDSFDEFGIDTRVKWTNDIYVGDRKMVGILIEPSYSGPTLARTILGTGINVNQTEFDPALPNPISMAQAAGGCTAWASGIRSDGPTARPSRP